MFSRHKKKYKVTYFKSEKNNADIFKDEKFRHTKCPHEALTIEENQKLALEKDRLFLTGEKTHIFNKLNRQKKKYDHWIKKNAYLLLSANEVIELRKHLKYSDEEISLYKTNQKIEIIIIDEQMSVMIYESHQAFKKTVSIAQMTEIISLNLADLDDHEFNKIGFSKA